MQYISILNTRHSSFPSVLLSQLFYILVYIPQFGYIQLGALRSSANCAQLIFNFFSNGIFVSFAFVLALCKFNCVSSHVLQFICGIRVCKILL